MKLPGRVARAAAVLRADFQIIHGGMTLMGTARPAAASAAGASGCSAPDA